MTHDSKDATRAELVKATMERRPNEDWEHKVEKAAVVSQSESRTPKKEGK